MNSYTIQLKDINNKHYNLSIASEVINDQLYNITSRPKSGFQVPNFPNRSPLSYMKTKHMNSYIIQLKDINNKHHNLSIASEVMIDKLYDITSRPKSAFQVHVPNRNVPYILQWFTTLISIFRSSWRTSK